MSREPKSKDITEAQSAEPRVIYLPPDRGQRVADSPAVQDKLKAGTHCLERVAKYARMELQGDQRVTLPLLDAQGKETIKTFNIWKIPKKERPFCGARCRDGSSCRARVAVKDDGTFQRRCRMHGAASPLATGAAPVKARIASLQETSDDLRGRIAELEKLPTPPESTIAYLNEVQGELEATIELLKNGPAEMKQKRVPRPKKPQEPSVIVSEEEMTALLKQIGVI